MFGALLAIFGGQILASACTIDCNFAGCLDGCAGCDCSSCGCDCGTCEECGLGPIPGGYSSVTVANAAQVRLTGSGLSFIEANTQGILEGLASSFVDTSNGLVVPIPPINQTQSGATVVGCSLVEYPAGSGTMVESCYVRATIMDVQLNPVDGTNRLYVEFDVDLDTLDETGASAPINIESITALGINLGGCPITFNGTGLTYFVEVGFQPIPAGRIFEGYSEIVVGNHNFVGGEAVGGLQASTINADGCPLNGTGALQINYAETIAQSGNETIQGGADPGLVDQLAQFLCYQVPDPTYCPAGSTAVDLGTGTAFTCTENAGPNAGNCVPFVLGLENRIDFSKMLAGISPATQSTVDMVMAIAGDGIADSTGYSLDMLSGAEPVAPNDCVPWEDVVLTPPVVPMAANFHSDIAPDFSSDHHIAIGISEAYGNYFMGQLWKGGTFCLSVGTSVSDLLTTSLLSIVIPGLGDLAKPASSASLAVNVRPNLPPEFVVGDTSAGEPLIGVTMPDLDVDFYVWSNERYIRFMTLNSDFVLGLDVSVDAMGDIGIDIADLGMQNAVVTNADNLTGDPATIGPTIAGFLSGGLVDMFLPAGGIPAFSLPDFGSLTLDVDMQQATEGTDNFLGIFVTLGGTFTGLPLQKRADTTVEVTTVNVPDATPFAPETFGEGELPTVEIAMAGSGFDGAEYEFSYRIDGMGWSDWTRSRYAVIDDPGLLMQGRHTVEARARAVGVRSSSDLSPASAEFLIDVMAPTVEVEVADGTTKLFADDIVSAPADLQVRTRAADGDWSEWAGLGSHERVFSGELLVQVRDEAGNVGGATAEIRGEPTNATDQSCGSCSNAGDSLPTTGLFGLLFASMLFTRRRRRA